MGTIRKKGTRYYYRFVNEAGKRLERAGTSDRKTTERLLLEAERRAALIEAGIISSLDNRVELAGLLQKYLEFLRLNRRPSHLKSAMGHLEYMIEGTRAQTVEDLTPGRVENYLNRGRRGELSHQIRDRQRRKVAPGWSARTANLALITTKTFLHWAHDRQIIGTNPLIAMKPVKGEKRKTRRAMTGDEVERFLSVAREPGRSLWAFLLGTGCRLNEAISLKWREVDLFGGTVYVRPEISKNHEGRTIPLNQALLEILWGRFQGDPEKLVFATKTGTLYLGTNLRRIFRRDLAAASLPLDGTLDIHALRKTFISGLARCGVHPRTAQLLAGHKRIEMTLGIYTEVSGQDARRAVEGLDFFQQKKTEEPPRKVEDI